jgi:hypothetical protein
MGHREIVMQGIQASEMNCAPSPSSTLRLPRWKTVCVCPKVFAKNLDNSSAVHQQKGAPEGAPLHSRQF